MDPPPIYTQHFNTGSITIPLGVTRINVGGIGNGGVGSIVDDDGTGIFYGGGGVGLTTGYHGQGGPGIVRIFYSPSNTFPNNANYV